MIHLMRIALLLTILLLVPLYAYAQEQLTATTNREVYGYGDLVRISGTVPEYVEGVDGSVKVFNPKNRVFVDDKFAPNQDRTYAYAFILEGNLLEEGSWSARISYHGNNRVIGFTVSKAVQSAVDTDVILEISTDKSEYLIGDTVRLNGKALPVSDKSVVVQVFNPSNFALSFGQIKPANDGRFEHSFVLQGSNAIEGDYTIRVTYSEKTVTYGIRVISIEPAPDIEETPDLPKITASPISIVDANGTEKPNANVGEQILIQTSLTNNQNRTQNFAYIVQVKDEDGVVRMISWIKSTLNAKQTATVAQSWMADERGRFALEVFVWEDVSNPVPLTDNVRSSVRVL